MFFRKENVENYYWFFKQSGRRNGGFYLIVWITHDIPIETACDFWHFGIDKKVLISGKIISMNSKIDEDSGNPDIINVIESDD